MPFSEDCFIETMFLKTVFCYQNQPKGTLEVHYVGMKIAFYAPKNVFKEQNNRKFF